MLALLMAPLAAALAAAAGLPAGVEPAASSHIAGQQQRARIEWLPASGHHPRGFELNATRGRRMTRREAAARLDSQRRRRRHSRKRPVGQKVAEFEPMGGVLVRPRPVYQKPASLC